MEAITANRLFEAAEAVLAFAVGWKIDHPLDDAAPWPCDVMGDIPRPELLRNFTIDEVEEASYFLIRMGHIERRQG